jgi:hypothetical protein
MIVTQSDTPPHVGFDGLMVMISVSHTEGSEFDPGSSHFFLSF